MEQQDDNHVVTLRRMVVTGKGDKTKTTETLTLREPTALEMGKISLEETQVSGLILMISLVAGVSREVASGLCSRDLDECDEILASYKLAEGEEPTITEDDLDEYTFTLRKPVKLGEETHATLTLCEPTGKEKERASRERTETLQCITLISAVAKLPRVFVERLCARDFAEACLFLAACRSPGRQIGVR